MKMTLTLADSEAANVDARPAGRGPGALRVTLQPTQLLPLPQAHRRWRPCEAVGEAVEAEEEVPYAGAAVDAEEEGPEDRMSVLVVPLERGSEEAGGRVSVRGGVRLPSVRGVRSFAGRSPERSEQLELLDVPAVLAEKRPEDGVREHGKAQGVEEVMRVRKVAAQRMDGRAAAAGSPTQDHVAAGGASKGDAVSAAAAGYKAGVALLPVLGENQKVTHACQLCLHMR